MKNLASGYLVVLKSLPPSQTPYNARYRGIDRTPPFSIDAYQKGFDDPYLSRNFIDSDGLIPTIELARQALRVFSEYNPTGSLEMIFVHHADDQAPQALGNYQLLGYDVASGRPFWSIVNESPSPEDPLFKPILGTLNANGLFASAEEAEDYRQLYESQQAKKHVKDLRVWAVYHVMNSDQSL